MDVTPYAELKVAPLAVFDALSERRTRVRFMLLTPDGLRRWRGPAQDLRKSGIVW